MIVIGGGPAGLTAAIFASRAGLGALLVTEDIGGLMLWTEEIENYPGLRKVNSRKLVDQMAKQAESFGTKIVKSTVRKVGRTKSGIELLTDAGKFEGKSLIIASGLKHRRLRVEGEDLPGVSYCAVCDGPLYEDMNVHVIGSGDSAMIDAIFLSKIAKSVNIIVIHEEPNLDASEYLKRRVLALRNIRFVWRSVVDKILGEKFVEGIQVRDLKTGKTVKLRGDAVFIKVGLVPRTEFLEGFVELTKEKFVKVADERALETSQEGVFAAGDVREKIQRQVATAVGDGSLAAESVFRYLEEQEYLDKMFESERIMVVSFWDSSVSSSSQDALLGRLERELGQKVGTLKVDCYKRKRMAERFGIKEVPSTLVMRKREILWQMTGEIGPNELIERVKVYLNREG